jgi:NitT/TauT family transport system permease protein
MKKVNENILRIALPTLCLAAVFGFWTLYVRNAEISPFVLPPPGKIATAFYNLIFDPAAWRHARITVIETLGGFLSATVVGILAGTAMAKFQPLEWAFKPFIIILQLVPKIALAPLFVLWFGFGLESKIVISAVLSFFPIFANTLLAIKSVDAGDREVFASLRAGPLQTFLLLEWPSALPVILTGMEIAIVLATIGAIVGEFIGGNAGLGHLALSKLQELQVDGLFAVILMLTLIGLVMYGAVTLLRRLLVPWHQASGNVL